MPHDIRGLLQVRENGVTSEDGGEVKDREQLFWEKVQSQNKVLKLEAGPVEQIAKLEHQVAQQQTMLHDVRSKLEVVYDEVCALRAEKRVKRRRARRD